MIDASTPQHIVDQAASSQHTASTSTCHLLSIAPELRNHIYDLALPHDIIALDTKHSEPSTFPPPVTRASRQLRQETLAVWYSHATLRLTLHNENGEPRRYGGRGISTLGKSLRRLGDRFGFIRHIQFRNQDTCDCDNYFEIRRGFGARSPFELSKAINETECTYRSVQRRRLDEGLKHEMRKLNRAIAGGHDGIHELMSLICEALWEW